MGYIFTSESVSEGHPDKVCDQISDAILDSYLAQDPNSRVACETLIKNNTVIVAGEITSNGTPNIEEVIRNTVNEIGYNQDDLGFNGNNCEIQNLISKQSPDIAQGVNEGEGEDLDQGAGDQGLMFGYACSETPVLMPAPINLSHELVLKQSEVRKNGELSWLRPDAKSQVSVVYKDDRKTVDYVSAIVLSTQHDDDVSQEEIKEGVMESIIKPVVPEEWILESTKIFINPTGKFVIGGPVGDCGLTGRKIIVDTYGGMARHGGGAFSGKDPPKVDRSAAYAARYVAKNIVAADLADRCTIQIAYAIGVSKPLSVYVDTAGTGRVDDSKLAAAAQEAMDLSPRGIREHLNLSRPIYARTSAYGHFGREPEANGGFSWEATDLVDALKSALT